MNAEGEQMASTKAYLNFVLEQFSELDEITVRPMMGEYVLYCGERWSAACMTTDCC